MCQGLHFTYTSRSPFATVLFALGVALGCGSDPENSSEGRSNDGTVQGPRTSSSEGSGSRGGATVGSTIGGVSNVGVAATSAGGRANGAAGSDVATAGNGQANLATKEPPMVSSGGNAATSAAAQPLAGASSVLGPRGGAVGTQAGAANPSAGWVGGRSGNASTVTGGTAALVSSGSTSSTGATTLTHSAGATAASSGASSSATAIGNAGLGNFDPNVAWPGVTAQREPLVTTNIDAVNGPLTGVSSFAFNGAQAVSTTDGRFTGRLSSNATGTSGSFQSSRCFKFGDSSTVSPAWISISPTDTSGVDLPYDWAAEGVSQIKLVASAYFPTKSGATVSVSIETTSGTEKVDTFVAVGSSDAHTMALTPPKDAAPLKAIRLEASTIDANAEICIQGIEFLRPMSENYTATCPLITDGSVAKQYVKNCAEFWAKCKTTTGFYTEVDRTGANLSSAELPLGQWRLTYGFTRTFMLTGEEKYLSLAEFAMDWDPAVTTTPAVPRTSTMWERYDGFEYNYAQVGKMAYCDATRDPNVCSQVTLDEPPNGSVLDFNTTVDAFTTRLILLRLHSFDEPAVRDGFQRWADLLFAQARGLTGQGEGYDLKLAWTLYRVGLITGREEFFAIGRDIARKHIMSWTRSGGDEWWYVEEEIVSGLLGFALTPYKTERNAYLRLADTSADVYLNGYVDREYGEVYRIADRNGAIDPIKGTQYKSGYHSIELGFFAYVYGSLFLRHEPFTLYYRFRPASSDRAFTLTPVAIGDNQLVIREVKHDGAPYGSFVSRARQLRVPAEMAGIFAVTFEGTGL